MRVRLPKPRTRLRVLAAVAFGALAVAIALFVRPADRDEPAGSQPLRANAATLPKVFASATDGDTILLSAGDYGTFRGGVKAGTVTLRPDRGASVTMALQFRRAAGIRLEGLDVAGAELRGRTRRITIADSTFSGAVVIRAHRMTDAAIVLERNRLPGIDVCAGCYEGRIHVLGSSGRPSGVVIRDNVLGPGGNADGVQISATGVHVLGNRFVGILADEGPDAPHTDALQLYGSEQTVIRGNEFRDVTTAIMAPDGARNERIEDNVFDTGGYPYAVMLGGDVGSVIRHNTMPELGNCYDGAPCGTLLIGAGPDGAPGRGTVVEDNVIGRLSVNDGSELASSARNLIAVDGAGADDTIGRPAFVGGPHPDSRAGFALAEGSPGRAAAADGRDVGIARPAAS